MNANLFRKAARESRRMGHTFTAVAIIMAIGAIGCFLHRGAGSTITLAATCIFFGFLAATCFADAEDAEEAAREWETKSDHDHIEIP